MLWIYFWQIFSSGYKNFYLIKKKTNFISVIKFEINIHLSFLITNNKTSKKCTYSLVMVPVYRLVIVTD